MRRVWQALLPGLVLLLLAGCLKIDGDLTINGTESDAPETVSGTVVVAVSNEWAISEGIDPASIRDSLARDLAAAPDSGMTGTPYEDGEYTGAEFVFDELPIDRLGPSTDGAFQVVRDGDRLVVRGDLSVLDAAGSQTPWSVRAAITLPEDVSEHNGSLDGRTVRWTLDESSEDRTIFATSAIGPVSWFSRVPPALIALTLLAGAGAALAWWLSRHRDRTAAGAPTSDDPRARQQSTFRARQAQARGASTTKLDEMLENARKAPPKPPRRGARPGKDS